ncbi:hypothetical protein GOP47_0010132 [Adiantum capillus-veneris]|uniref:Uncharacterized protein n=1 Tax=Adiantum capillus-veneris TaxID=13818 RepID=A0A9D4ZIH3_ADICA|nr:hypothetical protein GOP47_0010132 [Adiantum capillus-veneris]
MEEPWAWSPRWSLKRVAEGGEPWEWPLASKGNHGDLRCLPQSWSQKGAPLRAGPFSALQLAQPTDMAPTA